MPAGTGGAIYSTYFSLEALAARPSFAGGDLSTPHVLRSALSARAFKSELILFTFDFCAVQDALNLVLVLRQAGFEHVRREIFESHAFRFA